MGTEKLDGAELRSTRGTSIVIGRDGGELIEDLDVLELPLLNDGTEKLVLLLVFLDPKRDVFSLGVSGIEVEVYFCGGSVRTEIPEFSRTDDLSWGIFTLASFIDLVEKVCAPLLLSVERI